MLCSWVKRWKSWKCWPRCVFSWFSLHWMQLKFSTYSANILLPGSHWSLLHYGTDSFHYPDHFVPFCFIRLTALQLARPPGHPCVSLSQIRAVNENFNVQACGSIKMLYIIIAAFPAQAALYALTGMMESWLFVWLNEVTWPATSIQLNGPKQRMITTAHEHLIFKNSHCKHWQLNISHMFDHNSPRTCSQ